MFTQPSNRRALLTYLTAFVILATLVSACAPSVGSAGSIEETPLPTEPISDPTGLPGEPQPAQIDDVTVEIGVGSPIPVFAIISGNLPSPCDQIAQVRQEQTGSAFKISILTTTSIETTCIPDALPFVLRVPLSMVNLAGGDYTVEVNDKQTTFNFPNGSSEVLLPEANSEPVFQEAIIDGVDMEVGVGSPIPVHLIISGSLPDICAQISEIQLSRIGITGNGFHIGIMTRSIANEACQRDTLPFRLEFPMNIVSLPNGAFNVRVNSFEASFDPRASTGTPIAGEDTAILDTSDWQAFRADSGYEIRYPLALY